MSMTEELPSQKAMVVKYICGLDIRSRSCSGYIIKPDKSVAVKLMTFANSREGWKLWQEKLSQLGVPPNQILIGMEATSRHGEKLYHDLEQNGYLLRLIRPRIIYWFHENNALHAKTTSIRCDNHY